MRFTRSVLVGVALAAAACGGPARSNDGESARAVSPEGGASPSPAAGVGSSSAGAEARTNVDGVTIKPPLRGVIAMGTVKFHNRGGSPASAGDITSLLASLSPGAALQGVVINAAWSELEPTPGSFSTASIDDALEVVRAFNRDHPTGPLATRLRIWPGTTAPDWAKTLDSAQPITVTHNDLDVEIGPFWSDGYRQAWRALQAALADRYDAEPLVREVSMTSCSSITDEPFIVATDDASIAAMRAAGLTDAAYRACLLGAGDDYAAWKTTASDFPFNPFRATDSGASVLTPDVTVAVMNAWRSQRGPRGILSNHDLGTAIGNQLAPVVAQMRSLGPGIELQLFGPAVADVDGAVTSGASMGGSAIELWNTTLPSFTAEQLRGWATALGVQ
jgi:hypothetical protein